MTAPTTVTPGVLRIVLHGMSERSTNTFAMLFGSPQWRDCALAGTAPPDLGIVDLDSPTPDRTWQDYRKRHPELPTIVLSLREQQREHARWLKKPLDAPTLRKALDDLRRDLAAARAPARASATADRAPPATASRARQASAAKPPIAPPGRAVAPVTVASPVTAKPPVTAAPAAAATSSPQPSRPVAAESAPTKVAPPPPPQAPQPFGLRRGGDAPSTRSATRLLDPELAERCCGNDPDVAPGDLAAISRVVYDPRRYLQGMLERAIVAARHSGQSHAVTGLQQPLVVLGGKRPRVATPMNENVLRSLCLVHFEPRSLGVALATNADLESVAKAPIVASDAMLWQVALWTGRGRLRRSLSVDAPVRLLRWPNFTRMIETPEAMRIAATITDVAHTPIDIATRLGIPQRYVFSFLSAARAIGHLERITLDASADAETTISPTAMGDRRPVNGPSRAAPPRTAAKTAKPAPRPLLARILSKLRWAA